MDDINMADPATRLQGEFIDKSKPYNMEHQHTQHYIPHAMQFILLATGNTLSGTMLAELRLSIQRE